MLAHLLHPNHHFRAIKLITCEAIQRHNLPSHILPHCPKHGLKSRSPDGVEEDGCHPDEAKALEDIYHQKTESTAAAKAITAPITSSDNPGARLWNLLIECLNAVPRITGGPIPDPATRCHSKSTQPELNGKTTPETPVDGFLWRGLHGFGHIWADEHKHDDWRRTLAAGYPESRAKMQRACTREESRNRSSPGGSRGRWDHLALGIRLHCGCARASGPPPSRTLRFLPLRGGSLLRETGSMLEQSTVLRAGLWREDGTWGKEAAVMTLDRWLFWEEGMEVLRESKFSITKTLAPYVRRINEHAANHGQIIKSKIVVEIENISLEQVFN
ncbi:MAG: hypothetical protein Q9204_003757 [Flavoplaca sp. TL-2023a]